MKANRLSTAESTYNIKYRLALVLLLGALGLLILQCVYHWQIGRLSFNPFMWLIWLGSAGLMAYLPYRGGLILRPTGQPDSWIYVVTLALVIFALGLTLPNRGLDVAGLQRDFGNAIEELRTGLGPSTEATIAQQSDQREALWYNPVRQVELFLAEVMKSIWMVFMSVFKFIWNFLLRIVLVFVMGSVLAALAIMLVFAKFLDVRAGGALFWSTLLIMLCLLTLASAESYTQLVPPVVIMLVIAVGLVANTKSIQMNRPVWKYHPVYYELMCDLASTPHRRLSQSEVRETIVRAIDGIGGTDTSRLADTIERRLVDDALLTPLADGGYRANYCKRLGLLHLFVAAMATIYLLNGGFGVVELIPDNFPIIGNLDEAAIALGVFGWIGRLAQQDRAERDGERTDSAIPSGFPPIVR